MIVVEDIHYWKNLAPPLAPNAAEVALFARYSAGQRPVCLLGLTKALVPLCDFAIDLFPAEIGRPVLHSNWFDVENVTAGCVIGDGVINLAGLALIDKVLSFSPRFVCRVFLQKLPTMKYAQFFPEALPGAEVVIPVQEHIVLAVWNRQECNVHGG